MSLSQQLLLRFRPAKDKVFENFLSADNRVAVNYLRELCQSNSTETEQLYLWGASTSGKSHLLQAACSEATQYNKHCIFIPLKQWIKTGIEIFSGLESIDLICIDDVDCIAEQRAMENELFNLINRIRARNSYLIMAGRDNPRQLKLSLADLRSRLVWGNVYQLSVLNDTGKYEALLLHAKLHEREMPEKVLHYLLNHCARDMHSLVSAVNHIYQASFQNKQRITLPFAKQVLSNTTLGRAS